MKKLLFILIAVVMTTALSVNAATISNTTLAADGSNIDTSGTVIWAWSYDVCETLSNSSWGGTSQVAGSTQVAAGITWTRDGEEANGSSEEPTSWDFMDAGDVVVSSPGLFVTNPHSGHLFAIEDTHNTYTSDMLDIMNEFLAQTISAGPVTFTLNNLIVGLDYRLQILHDTKSGSVREQYVALRNDTNDADEVATATFSTTASDDTGKLTTLTFTASQETELVQLVTVSGRSQFNAAVLHFAKKEINATGTPSVTEGEVTGDTFSVALDSAPSGNVTVALNYDSNQVSLSDSFLLFTTSNWNTPQTVTVYAYDDFVMEDDTHETVIDIIPSGGGTEGYPAFVTVSITDNDELPPLLGTFVNSDPTNTEAEDGNTPWYTTVGDVDNLWRYRLATIDEVFIEDDVLEQTNQTVGGITDSRLAVTTIDGLTPGTEYEIRAVFWARQLGEYNALAGLDPDNLILLCPEYYFSTTYTGQLTHIKSDLVATGLVGGNIRLYEVQPLIGKAIADGSGEIKAYFSGVNLMDDNGSNYADQRTWFEGFRYQQAKLNIVETGSGTFVTDTSSDSFDVALTSAPSSDVTINLYEIGTSDVLGDITPDTLTFTSANWSTPQTVSVSGKAPPAGVDFYSSTVILEATSTDANYDGFITTLYVQDSDCGINDFNPLDLNFDCNVNLGDLALIAGQWLECTDPSNSSCTDGRPWNDPWGL